MSESALRRAALAAADALEAARDELGRLDAIAGDGDHGVTMALAARAVRQALADNEGLEGPELLTKIALAAGSVGGAIGPIWATGLIRAAAAFRALEPRPDSPTAHDVLMCAEAARTGITTLGGAKPGDKTLLDALDPAVDALRAAAAASESLPIALGAAAKAARHGADSTSAMVATLGRASRLGERSRGWADPGATSFAIAVEAMAASYAGAGAKE